MDFFQNRKCDFKQKVLKDESPAGWTLDSFLQNQKNEGLSYADLHHAAVVLSLFLRLNCSVIKVEEH
jgi:hypothetical protein